MSRVVPLFVLLSLATATRVSGVADPELSTQQVRDPVPVQPQGPAQPSFRRIPVGSASISGTVTDSATGRPISNVRVMLNGSDSAGDPAFQYTIVAAASDPRFWTPFSRRIVTARPDTTGRYAFHSLPPGDYFLAAVSDLEPGRQFDQELLRSLVGASVHVTLAEGGRVTQGLRVGR